MSYRPSGEQLEGSVAIVTGASRGLGRAIARAYAAEGAAVAVAARTQETWDERLPGTVGATVSEITAAGGRAIGVPCDVAKDEDLVRLVEATRDAFGPIDLLVHNAAVTVPGRPRAASEPSAVAARPSPPRPVPMSAKGYRLHFEVGAFAAYRLAQLVVPDMVELGRGRIVTVSSDASRRPGEGPYTRVHEGVLVAYGGNKAALEHLTQCLAHDLAPYGIAVNALLPSDAIETPGLLAFGGAGSEAGTADDFAQAAVRLALVEIDTTNGQLLYHLDVLHPELGRRGWLGG